MLTNRLGKKYYSVKTLVKRKGKQNGGRQDCLVARSCLPACETPPTPEGVNKGGRWVEGEVPVWHSLCGLTLPFFEIKNPSPIFFKKTYPI